ncbi:hypothetical protein BVC80_8973g29 [Macleaya cordata]|uniref:Uncharacterized protein n=1 Tax=Macleaya cordata TaxID=56857 RepID=A0A200PMP7_MACCD|nr:hypothetical protein BVC80_8973g29 [Macleaya cordata]
MGGKGQRRREKNYRAAHGGGYERLPPPPKPSDIDALPSKLRKLMDFTSPKHTNDPSKPPTTVLIHLQKPNSKDEPGSKTARLKAEGDDEKIITPKHKDIEDESSHMNTDDKKKAKKKRKQVNDLRFDATGQGLGSTGLKRKERKKKYLEAKKHKHKKAKTEESLDFPGHEKIKFGEVVEAPPKLSAVPKAFKTVQDASHERLRLQAVEAYRNRKGWVSRPGIQLPTSITPDPSF